LLGFRRVATVTKQRRPYVLEAQTDEMTILIDSVQNLGNFVEVELLVGKNSQIDVARDRIRELSNLLGLRMSEPRSYLQMVLESDSEIR
jgi:adenylate cyclase class 2